VHEGNDGFARTAPVGSFPLGRSPFGLFDTAGNVAEWTTSAWCPYPREACDEGLHGATVIRGASFRSNLARHVAVTARAWTLRAEAYDWLGFRCARSRPDP
jgi:formylglycine-generating enzyme required for sulfatase activity